MKYKIIKVLVLIAVIFLIIFLYNMRIFTKGVIEDANNDDLKLKGVKNGVLVIPSDSLKIIMEKYPSN